MGGERRARGAGARRRPRRERARAVTGAGGADSSPSLFLQWKIVHAAHTNAQTQQGEDGRGSSAQRIYSHEHEGSPQMHAQTRQHSLVDDRVAADRG